MRIGRMLLSLLTLLAGVVLLTSCATSPKQHLIANEKGFDREYDHVWTAVVQFFAENNVPIKTLEKVSGLIAAESQSFPKDWSDCGSPGLLSQQGPYGTFNVFVKQAPQERVSVTVNCQFWCERKFSSDPWTRSECSSTGKFEDLLLKYVDLTLKE